MKFQQGRFFTNQNNDKKLTQEELKFDYNKK